MDCHDSGPRRSESIESYLRETRAAAFVALLALIAGIVSDEFEPAFWSHHALLSGLASSVIVVMLSIALINEAIERQKRRRWSVLAQYVMLQLVLGARSVWTGVAQLAGLMPSGSYGAVPVGSVIPGAASIDQGASVIQDTPRLRAAVRTLVADVNRRRELHDEIESLAKHSDEVLGRWAAVMLNSDAYAEILDRHVELAGDLAWLSGLLDNFEPSEVQEPRDNGEIHPGPQREGQIDDEPLADRVVAIAQLAERLDRGTLELASRLVPVEWWAARLGATTSTSTRTASQSRSADRDPANEKNP